MSAPPPTAAAEPSLSWADRGWYLAIEYGVLARDRFLKRLPHLREQGRFKELLEPGGKILYRNLFRATEVKQAWEALTALQPWKDHLTCYLLGEEVALKEVQDVLWCAAYMQEEAPCRGGGAEGKVRRAGCPGAKIRLTSGDWSRLGPDERHVWTFASVDDQGMLVFDQAGIADFVRGRGRGSRCPASPAADAEAFAAHFQPVSVRSLGWPLIAELGDGLRARLGESDEALTTEHGVVLRKGETLEPQAQLELRWRRGAACLLVHEGDGKKVGSQLRITPELAALVQEGVYLRAVRVDEAYVRREDGHFDLEQRFVQCSRITLGPADRPATFTGYRLQTFPRVTPQYEAWVDRLVEALR
jgi:hypothetical protein